MEKHYTQNGPDGKMEAEEVSQINYPTSLQDELAYAATLDEEDEVCEDCGGTGILRYDYGQDGQRDQKCRCQYED